MDLDVRRRLLEWRVAKRFRQPYAEIAMTPIPALVLRERLDWTHEELMATPRQVVRDFLVIADYEAKLSGGA